MAVAWFFGDGFDLYRDVSDMALNYWDTAASSTLIAFSAGRATGSRCLRAGSSTTALTKASGSNDPIHHFNFAWKNTETITGTTDRLTLTIGDGATTQCSITIQSGGNMLLKNNAGTTLATYSAAVSDALWNGFECEVVINNTTGSFKVRKNGALVDDFSATGLNTRNTANNYANKISINLGNTNTAYMDDFLWRSDPSSVSWIGDIQSSLRLPDADVSVAFTRSAATIAQTPFIQQTTANLSNGTARYSPFVATASGTLGSVIISMALALTGNMKATLFTDNAGAPGTAIASATSISNPVAGNNTFTFSSPPSLVRGTTYWLGTDTDATSASALNTSATFALSPGPGTSTTAYASFPAANPVVTSGGGAHVMTLNITPTTVSNAMLVAEQNVDSASTYLSDNVVNDADFYSIQSIASTPTTTIAVVTRGLLQKSDGGARSAAVQLKSGASTVTSTSTSLTTGWKWQWRTDEVAPDTGVAWTATGVNNVQIGPKVTA